MKKLLAALLFASLVTGVSSSAIAEGMMGEHDMSGTVTKVDHKSGMVYLKTGAGSLNLHFPPDTVKDLKKGDKISVHLAFKKG
jgi:hypothetical protein